MNKIDLSVLFESLQKTLLSELEVSRSISHPTTHGDDAELNWTNVLKSLPSRYKVSRGFVVDSQGNLSEQIDAIVYDNYYSPLIFNRESTIYVPAESVYAVLEIKPELSKDTLEYAGKKAKSVRDLQRTSMAVRQIDGSYKSRELPPILSGLLTAKSSWSPAFGDSFNSALTTLTDSSRIDLGIALQDGSFNFSQQEDGAFLVNTSPKETALISFFINLTKRLQMLGNAPGIDLDTYFKCY